MSLYYEIDFRGFLEKFVLSLDTQKSGITYFCNHCLFHSKGVFEDFLMQELRFIYSLISLFEGISVRILQKERRGDEEL